MFKLWYRLIEDNSQHEMFFDTAEEAQDYWYSHFTDFSAIEITDENNELISLWDYARY